MTLVKDQSSAAALEPLLAVLAHPASWRKCIVTPGKSAAPFVPWEKLTAQPVTLSKGVAIKLVTRSSKHESTVTLPPERFEARLREALEAGPCHLDVLAPDHDWHARRTRDGRWLVTRARPSLAAPAAEVPAEHNRRRQHPLALEDAAVQRLFMALGLAGKSGQVLGDAAAKVRQVQHYIELLRTLPAWQSDRPVRVVDAGCGKAYLSLSLLLWARQNRAEVSLHAVDAEPSVVDTVRRVAAEAGLENVTTHSTTIEAFAASQAPGIDLLVSLHACDTATDEALAAGIALGAEAIVLVPCCHHELVAQVQAGQKSGALPAAEAWGATLRSGLLTHRLADIVTDSLRAGALEALGYTVDVIEFVSPEATARNVMLRAVRTPRPSVERSREAFERYTALARQWAVQPSLERLLGASWPPSPPKA
jgi:hypothetical protein